MRREGRQSRDKKREAKRRRRGRLCVVLWSERLAQSTKNNNKLITITTTPIPTKHLISPQKGHGRSGTPFSSTPLIFLFHSSLIINLTGTWHKQRISARHFCTAWWTPWRASRS